MSDEDDKIDASDARIQFWKERALKAEGDVKQLISYGTLALHGSKRSLELLIGKLGKEKKTYTIQERDRDGV